MMSFKQYIKSKTSKQHQSTLRHYITSFQCIVWQYTMAKGRELKAPIFVIGSPRSGTTISVRLFGTHPDIANWSEAGRVWDPFSYDDPDADHCWGADRYTSKDARRIHARFECFRQMHKKERFVNKHPRNSVRIDYILKIFPDFIIYYRKMRKCFSSITLFTDNIMIH